MAWEEHLEPDLLEELPFFISAAIVYASLFALNPTIRWGSAERAPDHAVPIEFVASLPAPSPNLAPALGGGDDKTPRRGPGEYAPEKVRAGAPQAPPKPRPSPKPAAPAVKPRASRPPGRAAPHPIAKPRPRPRPAPDPAVLAAREAAREEAAREAQAAKEEAARERAAKAQAAAEARQRRAEARAAAAEAARVAAAERAAARAAALEAARRAAAEKAAAAKAEAERRAAAERERKRQIAAARAEAARKKAELAQTLATMSDPDEALDASEDSGGAAPGRASTATAPKKGPKTASPASGDDADSSGGRTGARKASAAAALADSAEPTEAGDAPGNGGTDLLDAKASGGGAGPDGSGVSWTMDGPVGSRRVLKRAAPTSPDWVGARGLDLTVTVRFQVLPDGTVKAGAVIQKTSGFPEIDRRALDALARWRFEAADGAPETWGRVTFRFTSA